MVKYAEVERKPGVYRAAFVGLDTDYEIHSKDSDQDEIVWRWTFQDVNDSTTVGELDTITSPSFRARTNGLKFFTGMLGRPPTDADDTDDHIGEVFDVYWGPNNAGRNTIVNVMRVIDGPAEAPAPGTTVATPSRPAPTPLP